MSDLDRNAILKEMGITQWVLRDAQAGENPAQDVPVPLAQTELDNPSGNESSAKVKRAVEAVAQPVAETTPAVQPQAVEPKALSLESLRAEVAICAACALAKSRTQTVFGEGPDQADWLFVGEAPGQQEDRQGQPFVGRSGGLLTQMIKALNKSREQVYIANTLKCRPPNNRDPLPDELQACEPFLLKQIQLLQPKVIVALGRISAQALLGSDQPLGGLRGQVYQYGPDNIPLIVTYHPAYLLRQPADKGKVWADLLLAHRQIPL
jgi:uracil-DNA glycosylase family 4